MKKMRNYYKNQDGVILADCVASVIIIVMTLGIILALYSNSVLNIKTISRRSEATRIIVNIAENLDGIYYSTFEREYNNMVQNEDGEHYFIGTENSDFLGTQILPGYSVYLNKIEDYDEKIKLKIRVKYTINGEKQEISLTKFVEKEGI